MCVSGDKKCEEGSAESEQEVVEGADVEGNVQVKMVVSNGKVRIIKIEIANIRIHDSQKSFCLGAKSVGR